MRIGNMLLHKLTVITLGLLITCKIKLLSCETSNPIVKTSLGEVKGSTLSTVGGKPIYAFRAIRYAKPPVGDLRFEPPVPVEKWNDVYDATQDGPMCPQPQLTPISEDCLFLNVYSTKLPENGENPNRPVIIFIHFGGYVAFAGTNAWIGPDYLLDEDVVLVTMNYRLGALGFLNTGDKLAPGNNGVKDQVVALKWVKEHIAAFGGDPNMITLSGASVGGVSVSLHLVSPMSKGLFTKAIAMSGSSYGNWPVTSDFGLAQKQARLVGCPDDTSANIISCLKTKSIEELNDSLKGFAEFGGDPILIWHPVIEPDFGQERFLTDHPVKLIMCGEFTEVPVLTGISTEEFGYLALSLEQNMTLLKEMEDNFERVAPISFLYERDTDNSKFMSKELKKHYLGDGPYTESTVNDIAKLYADSIIAFSVNRIAKLMAAQSAEPVYYYRFSYRGPYSNFYNPSTGKPYGVVHLDDLIYLYYTSTLFPRFKQTDPEYATVKKMTTLWANFARTGKPIPKPTEELDNVNWEPYTTQGRKYLEIGEKLAVMENLNQDRYSVWEKILPLPKCEE